MNGFVPPMGAQGAAFYNRLDAFAQGYVTALIYTAAATPDDDISRARLDDLSGEARARIEADCALFLQALRPDRTGRDALARAIAERPDAYDRQRAGQDFWFTRNGFPRGFWSRNLGAAGDELDDIACDFARVDIFRDDDGKIEIF